MTIVVAFLCSIALGSDSTQEIHKRHSSLTECKVCPQTPECTSRGANSFPCQCDAECFSFNDCCTSVFSDLEILREECEDAFSISLSDFYKCNSLVTNARQKEIAVYMVSECPSGWAEEEVEVQQELGNVIVDNCITLSNSFPPVTDVDSGVVYRNEYCALCHGARGPVLWPTFFSCSGTLTTVIPSQPLTPQLLTEYCFSSHHYPPPFHFETTPPRMCTQAISTCLSERNISEFIDEFGFAYNDLLDNCETGYQSLVAASSFSDGSQIIFRNKECALCNGYYPEDLECFNNMTSSFVVESELQVVVLLNTVDKIAHVSGKKSRFSSDFEADCQPDSIYDATALRCRETVCNFVIGNEPTKNNSCNNFHNVIGEDGVRIMDIDITNNTSRLDNTTRPANDTDTENPTATTEGYGGQFTCQSVMVIEDMSEFVVINATLIFYKPLGVIALVIGTAANQLPIVCLDFAIPFINPETLKLFLQLQKFYGGLVFATSIISVVLCASIIVVYFLRPMRSVFGAVVINIAIIFLVSDIVIILVGHSTFANANQSLCVLAAIAEQLINLALFVWLAIFAIDIAIRYHRNANSLQPRSKKRVILIYLLVGWIIPLSLTTVGILANFATRGAVVQYGQEGNCHITHVQSSFVLFTLPDLICLIIAVLALVVILVLLCKIRYSFERRDKCRFILLFIFYLFLVLLWLIWFTSLRGGFVAFIKQLFLPVLFLFRSVFFFFMVAFSKKALKTIRGSLGMSKTKINPSGGVPNEDGVHYPEHKGCQRDSIKSLIDAPVEQHTEDSFASYLENPVAHTRTHAWQEAAQTSSE